MVDEKPKMKILKVKRESGESKSDLLKTSLKSSVKVKTATPDRKDRETLERKDKGTPERKDKGSVKGKDPVNASKDSGKVNSMEKVKVKDLVKVKDEKEKEKRTSPAVKTALVKIAKVEPVSVSKLGSATKVTPKTIKGESSSGLGNLIKKKVATTTTTVTKTIVKEEKKGKKVYTLPGQKHDSPEERDALRIFYETLHEQIPTSEMAEIWMMEYGLLPYDEAKKAFERKQRRGQQPKNGTPVKFSSTPLKISNGSVASRKSSISNGKGKEVTSTKGKKKREESDSDDDFLQTRVKKKLKS